MPTYEYACPKCGQFEVIQKITEPALATCPTCGSPVQRLVSAAAFHLKGSGWYKTDYASGKSSGGSSSSSSESSSSKPAESKPAAESPGSASTPAASSAPAPSPAPSSAPAASSGGGAKQD